MSFYDPDNLRSVLSGRWLQRVPVRVSLDGVAVDSRDDLEGRIFFAITGERHDGHDFLEEAVKKGAGLLVIERTPSGPLPAGAGVLLVPDVRRSLGRLARTYRTSLPLTKVIAITGSAGKTTTKMLVHAVLSTTFRGTAAPRSYNNDIGVPLTLLAARPGDAYVVVEIGSNGRGEVGHLAQIADPDIAVITLAGRSHLEGLGTVEDVAREKMAILGYLREGGLAIINADVPLLRPALRRTRNSILYGRADDAHLRLTKRGGRPGRWWFEVNGRQRLRLGLPGEHNAMNALAALGVARRLGVSDERIAEALEQTTALPMRLDRQDVGDCRVYNDTYNANPESMDAALETFAELEAGADRRVLVLGEMAELGEAGPALHRELGRRIIEIDHRTPIDHVVLVGELTGQTAEELRASWDAGRITRRLKLNAAARTAVRKLVRPGDAVLVKGSRSVGLEQVVEWISADVVRPKPASPKKKRTTRKKPAAAPRKTARKKKAPARKTAASKTAARKAPARKAPARKAPARKAPARKAPASKAPARKAPARKAPVRKKTAAAIVVKKKTTPRKTTATKKTATKTAAASRRKRA